MPDTFASRPVVDVEEHLPVHFLTADVVWGLVLHREVPVFADGEEPLTVPGAMIWLRRLTKTKGRRVAVRKTG
jgi:hypothetical protein